ncbi:patatin-like phospholipase family protein [Methylohalobius crimeensis]|uniref:patatin-like phospholipase family protein n=1 Tax=Methylohalobius crimeensis TaxID=244365 RepID=UPI0003B65AA1|nr:patatin-like phospholipase family protein [Methylohalobius crimeensis]
MATKLGLALSGGGFRASFYHIGVLAQMAEQGLLRHVEVISAVSGGSIIAALYYLHLKKLLESKPDDQIEDADYVQIMETIERDFFKAVETNLRMQTFSSFAANWEMRRADYSRSDRMAELYNKHFYRPILSKSGPIEMRELKIHPPGFPHFHPHYHNYCRKAKVPILILNATTLNTGRDWQFTARTMGEPMRHDDQGQSDYEESDNIPIRLRRARPGYDNMVPRQQNFTLGDAVAASACVPGLFHPLAVSELYRDGDDPIRVQLVDGGVHDNQGIGALRDESCTYFVVSDASGQMAFDHLPDTSTVPVLLRTASVLQDRVRGGNLNRLFETWGRDHVAFTYLRKGLAIRELSWIGPNGQPAEPDRTVGPFTKDYGVAAEVQERLADIRTDLDAFSEVEANSLMLDGFLASQQELARLGKALSYPEPATGEPPQWQFRQIRPWMENGGEDYLHQLEVARYQVGKPLLLIPWLLAVTVLAAIVGLILLWPELMAGLNSSLSVAAIVATLVVVLIDYLGRRLAHLKTLHKLAQVIVMLKYLRTPLAFYQAVKRFLLRSALPLLGTVFVQGYLRFINPLFLRRGSLERLKKVNPMKD